MNKNTKIIIAIVAIIAVIGIVVAVVMMNQEKNDGNVEGGNAESKLSINTADDMIKLVDDMYKGIEIFPSIETAEIDVNDKDMFTSVTGLESSEKIDKVVVSQPMMSSQAYSLVLVKVKDANDANAIAKEMNEKANPNKWICVSAERVYSTSVNNLVFFVMSDADVADPVYNNFKKLAGKIGQEYERVYEE